MQGHLRGSTLIVASLLAACANLGPAPVPARVGSYTVNADPQTVFNAALAVAPRLGLEVRSLSRAKGSVEFQHRGLSPAQLQSYCIYPGVQGNTPDRWQNLQTWSLDSVRDGLGPVSGWLDFSVQVSAAPGGTSQVSTRTTLNASTNARNFACESTGVLESEFQRALDLQAG